MCGFLRCDMDFAAPTSASQGLDIQVLAAMASGRRRFREGCESNPRILGDGLGMVANSMSHQFETVENHCLLVFTGESSFQFSEVVQDFVRPQYHWTYVHLFQLEQMEGVGWMWIVFKARPKVVTKRKNRVSAGGGGNVTLHPPAETLWLGPGFPWAPRSGTLNLGCLGVLEVLESVWHTLAPGRETSSSYGERTPCPFSSPILSSCNAPIQPHSLRLNVAFWACHEVFGLQ